MLVLSLIWAWIAWNAYHPWKSRPELFGIGSFICGFFAGELGLHLIAVGAALTLLIVWFGELSGFADALGLAITVTSWATLAVFYFRAQRAEPIIAQAVNYALGRTADAGIDFRGLVTHTPDIDRLRNPFAFRRDAIKRHVNIPHTQVGDQSLHIDLYHRSDRPTKAPVLLQIHGGAWVIGKRGQQALPLMTQMAENGWVCVDVQYRLSPTATFPDHIIDCKRALAWVKENIQQYGGDPEFIVVTGGSAGGHLSSLLALSANAPEFQPGFEGVDTRVQGCIPFYGVYDFLNSEMQRRNTGLEAWIAARVMKKTRSEDEVLWRQASPLCWIREDAPPFLIIHGEADTLVPVEDARVFYRELREVSAQPVAYAEIPDAQHAFDLVISLRNQIVVNYLCYYLSELHKQYLASGTGANTATDNIVPIMQTADDAPAAEPQAETEKQD